MEGKGVLGVLLPLYNLLTLTPEQSQALLSDGYDPAEVQDAVRSTLGKLNQKAVITASIRTLTRDQLVGVQIIASALANNEDHVKACQNALIKLTGLDKYDHTDPAAVLAVLERLGIS